MRTSASQQYSVHVRTPVEKKDMRKKKRYDKKAQISERKAKQKQRKGNLRVFLHVRSVYLLPVFCIVFALYKYNIYIYMAAMSKKLEAGQM